MSIPPTVTLLPYRSDDDLDRQLAAIGYAAATGWPDQRPITLDLVASRLAPPPGAGDTMLATATVADRLAGWAAIRPALPGGIARLWGPIVHPDAQGQGLGRKLLAAATATDVFAQCRDRLTSAEVPAKRTAARQFFTSVGWRAASGATLLHARPIPQPPIKSGAPLSIEPPAEIVGLIGDESLEADIARLFRATNPNHIADVSLRRWSADRRFLLDHLLVARDPFGAAAGAALLYPLAHVDETEPPEVLLADVLLDHGWQDRDSLDQLVAAALSHAATLQPESMFRAITSHRALVDCLVSYGADVTDEIVYFACPNGKPADPHRPRPFSERGVNG